MFLQTSISSHDFLFFFLFSYFSLFSLAPGSLTFLLSSLCFYLFIYLFHIINLYRFFFAIQSLPVVLERFRFLWSLVYFLLYPSKAVYQFLYPIIFHLSVFYLFLFSLFSFLFYLFIFFHSAPRHQIPPFPDVLCCSLPQFTVSPFVFLPVPFKLSLNMNRNVFSLFQLLSFINRSVCLNTSQVIAFLIISLCVDSSVSSGAVFSGIFAFHRLFLAVRKLLLICRSR